MRWCAALPLALSCCADFTVSNPVMGPAFGFVSGSRLRARVRVVQGGSRVLLGWEDTTLGTRCHFDTAEDGVIRCVPDGAQIVFADGACGQPVGASDPSCGAPPAYASATFPGDACEGVRRAFLVRAQTERPSRVYLGGGASAGCTRSTALDANVRTYALEPVDPATLVAATVERELLDDRLGREVLVASDGARQVRSLYDAAHGRCFSIAGAIGGGEDRCIPDAVAWATYAADASCKEPLAYQVRSSAACPRADVVVDYTSQSCNPGATYFSPGADIAIDQVYVGAAPACSKVASNPALYTTLKRDHVFYRVADPLAATEFPRLAKKPIGPGRLAVPTLISEHGAELAPARPDTFFDTALGAECRVYAFPDGRERCVPTAAATITDPTYEDADCTREIVAITRSPDCPDAPLPSYGARVTGDACSTEVGALAVVRLGASARTLHSFFQRDPPERGGRCTARAAAGVFVDVGAEVPFGSLGDISERVE